MRVEAFFSKKVIALLSCNFSHFEKAYNGTISFVLRDIVRFQPFRFKQHMSIGTNHEREALMISNRS